VILEERRGELLEAQLLDQAPAVLRERADGVLAELAAETLEVVAVAAGQVGDRDRARDAVERRRGPQKALQIPNVTE
jgi:hypothetical protein